MSIKNPNIPLLVEPINLDRHIQELQILLKEELPWLDRSYGRAKKGLETRGLKTFTFPEVYAGAKEYLNVLPNDNLTSQTFFDVSGSGAYSNYRPFHANHIKYKINLICYAHLDKVGWSLDRLKAEVLQVLTQSGKVHLLQIFDNPEDVFKDYSVNLVRSQLFRHPFGGFRIEMNIEFLEDCI